MGIHHQSRSKNPLIVRIKCPYGKAGDMMWQARRLLRATGTLTAKRTTRRHSVMAAQSIASLMIRCGAIGGAGALQGDRPRARVSIAGLEEPGVRWKPSIHMPRWASRVRPIIASAASVSELLPRRLFGKDCL